MVVKTTEKPNGWGWGWGRNGLEKTLINDETVESMAFEICNTDDGVDGLSWAEVEQCEVNVIVL